MTGGHSPHDNHAGYYSPSPLLHGSLYCSFGSFLHPSFVTCNQILLMYGVLTGFYVYCSLDFSFPAPSASHSHSLAVSFPASAHHFPLLFLSFPYRYYYLSSIFLRHSCFFNSHYLSLLVTCNAVSLSCPPFSPPLQYSIAPSLTGSLSPAEFNIPSFPYCQCMSTIF